jgi:hypothetical protein
MADYINIHGNNIPIRASDPTNPISGEVWYNSTTNALKGQLVTTSGTWASAANNLVSGGQSAGAGDTQNAAITFSTGATPSSNASQLYDGSSWTSGPNLNNQITWAGGSGTQTAALSAAGYFYPASPPPPVGLKNFAEEYNGSSWSSVNALNNTGYGRCSFGTQSATAAVMRADSGGTGSNEEYDGTSWTNATALPYNAYQGASTGSLTTGLIMGGIFAPGPTRFNNTTSYDGTNWTSETVMPDVKVGASATGDTSQAIIWGGQGPGPSFVDTTFGYNGTSWAADATMGLGRKTMNTRSGTATSAMTSTGESPSTNATEEYTGAGVPVTKTITTS